MNMKRAVAGTVVALLLAVTSMAAACDLSCAFGLADSDCHASGEQSQSSMASAIDMGGMSMTAGMTMSGMTDGQSQPSTPAISRAQSAHPSIGDMWPCERQSCDKGSFVFARGGRANSRATFSILRLGHSAAEGAALRAFHGARDEVATPPSFQASPLKSVLRI
jgi:hypothetical protein